MALEHARVSVGTTAKLLSSSQSPGAGMPTIAHSCQVQNPPSAGRTVFLGDATVSPSSFGVELHPGETSTVDLEAGEKLYGCATGTTTVNVQRASI